jgi:hypothetical protein
MCIYFIFGHVRKSILETIIKSNAMSFVTIFYTLSYQVTDNIIDL